MAGKGVERIQTSAGDDFDPNNHEAMSTVPRTGDDQRPGAVAIVWQVSGLSLVKPYLYALPVAYVALIIWVTKLLSCMLRPDSQAFMSSGPHAAEL